MARVDTEKEGQTLIYICKFTPRHPVSRNQRVVNLQVKHTFPWTQAIANPLVKSYICARDLCILHFINYAGIKSAHRHYRPTSPVTTYPGSSVEPQNGVLKAIDAQHKSPSMWRAHLLRSQPEMRWREMAGVSDFRKSGKAVRRGGLSVAAIYHLEILPLPHLSVSHFFPRPAPFTVRCELLQFCNNFSFECRWPLQDFHIKFSLAREKDFKSGTTQRQVVRLYFLASVCTAVKNACHWNENSQVKSVSHKNMTI